MATYTAPRDRETITLRAALAQIEIAHAASVILDRLRQDEAELEELAGRQ